MNTLIERFPKATLDLPLEIRHEFNIFTAKGRLLAGTGGTSSNIVDTYSQNVDNAKMLVHVLSTYDARDRLLRRVAERIREWQQHPASGGGTLADSARDIEAELAMAPIGACKHSQLDDGGTCLSCGGREPGERR